MLRFWQLQTWKREVFAHVWRNEWSPRQIEYEMISLNFKFANWKEAVIRFFLIMSLVWRMTSWTGFLRDHNTIGNIFLLHPQNAHCTLLIWRKSLKKLSLKSHLNILSIIIGNWYFDSSCYFQSFHIVQFEYWHERLSIDTIIVDSVAHIVHFFCGFCSNRILPYFPLSVRPCVTGVTSPISHIYKGINAMLIIRDPSTPIYSESKSSWLSF